MILIPVIGRYHSFVTAWKESTLAALQGQGYRSGGARQAVVELLAEQECCLTAQEIFDRLRENDRRVGIASVYRTLDLLVDKGFAQKVDIGVGVARYEPAHASGAHHHHIVCDNCGKVEAFADPRLERALHRVETSTGYAIAGHDVVLRGDCGDCRV
jgi:Fur family ferric uptake transcriptional regulator